MNFRTSVLGHRSETITLTILLWYKSHSMMPLPKEYLSILFILFMYFFIYFHHPYSDWMLVTYGCEPVCVSVVSGWGHSVFSGIDSCPVPLLLSWRWSQVKGASHMHRENRPAETWSWPCLGVGTEIDRHPHETYAGLRYLWVLIFKEEWKYI